MKKLILLLIIAAVVVIIFLFGARNKEGVKVSEKDLFKIHI